MAVPPNKRRRISKVKPKVPYKPKWLRVKSSNSNNGTYVKRTGNYLKGRPKRTGTHSWGTSHSYGFKTIPKWIYGSIKMVAPLFNGNSLPFQITNNIGLQGFDTGDSAVLGNRADLAAYCTSGSDKNFLHKIVGKLLCTNQTSANVTVDLYEWKCRRDNKSTGLGTQFNTASGGTTCLKFGTTPFMVSLCTQEFKILKVTRYVLAQGESFEHTMTCYINKIVDAVLIGDSTSYTGFKDYTYGILPIQNGLPYNDSTTKTQVSLGKNVCDYAFSKFFTTYHYGTGVGGLSAATTMVSSFTVAEDIMNEDSGAAGALVQA